MSFQGVNPATFSKFLKNTKDFSRVIEKVRIVSAENGNCLAELKIEEEHANPMGSLHGGLSATLVDIISTYGLYADEKNPSGHVSVDLHISYLKAAKVGEEIQIESKVVKSGRTLVFLEIEIRNKVTEEILVKGTHTKYFPGPSKK